MHTVSYMAVFEPSAEGYGVYFPDLPGCVSFGTTFEEAQKQAAEALGLHLYGMEQDGEEIPAPSAKPKIDPETAPGFLVSMVTVYPEFVRSELNNRRVKTNVTLPAWLKSVAEDYDVNLSRLLEAAIIEYVEKKANTTLKRP